MRRGRFQFVSARGPLVYLMIPGPPKPRYFYLAMNGQFRLIEYWLGVPDRSEPRPEMLDAAMAAVTENHKLRLFAQAIERSR